MAGLPGDCWNGGRLEKTLGEQHVQAWDGVRQRWQHWGRRAEGVPPSFRQSGQSQTLAKFGEVFRLAEGEPILEIGNTERWIEFA
jgi:hypothetical protein